MKREREHESEGRKCKEKKTRTVTKIMSRAVSRRGLGKH